MPKTRMYSGPISDIERARHYSGKRFSVDRRGHPFKKQLALIDPDLRYFAERIRQAVLIGPADQPKVEVHFGALVEVETPEGGRRTFAIVGEDEADAAQGKISWVSPLAQALSEARVGDAVTWKRPAGEVVLTIVAIRYPS